GVARDPLDVEARLLLGILHHQRGELDEAASHYLAVLDADDSQVAAHLNLGLVLFATGRPEAAIERLERALGRDPDLLEAHRHLGILYMDYVIQHDRAAEH